MNSLALCKYLISINTELIEKTALSNCHCIGLNSFIINEKPKIRLFIAESNCELFKEFNYLNPLIPIHPHKYDDMFSQLEGTLTHHLYEIGNSLSFNKYQYLRLSDKSSIKFIGNEYLNYIGAKSNIGELKAKELHTVSLQGERCSWLITETFEDKKFNQVAYHQNLVENKNLYTPIMDSINYLNSYFKYGKY
jgi:hypothetical protein